MPCRANSRAMRRALRALPRPARAARGSVIGVLDVLVIILVVVIILIVVVILGLRLEGRDQVGHLDGGTRAIAALVGGARLGLLVRVGGEYAVGHRDAGLEGDTADGRG